MTPYMISRKRSNLAFYNRKSFKSYDKIIKGEPHISISFTGGDVNLYGYVENNSINYTDPTGLWTFSASINLSGTLATLGATGGTNFNIGHNPSAGLLSGWSASITGTAGGGVSIGFGGGLGLNATITNAKSVCQLNGTSSEVGGGYGPVSAGKVFGDGYKGGSLSLVPSLWRTPTGAVPGYFITTSTSPILSAGGR